jgi:cytochrome c biogenesis protein CcmG/thiol:disulfide interchange protein DsbE
VLNFWASWCDPCRQEAPVLQHGWGRLRDDGVVFVGLNMQDLSDDARDFLREFDVSYPNVRDRGNEVARRWGVSGLPETFFLSEEGEVVGHVVGALSERELTAGVAAARAGRPAPVGGNGAGASWKLK